MFRRLPGLLFHFPTKLYDFDESPTEKLRVGKIT
jgi:hypothetical protein